LFNKISLTENLLYDKKSNYFLISYINRTYPEGTEDPFDIRIKYGHYLSIYDPKGENIFKKDILLQDFGTPFYVDNGLIYVSELIDKKLYVSIYQIKR
jgi:hypothetical protein